MKIQALLLVPFLFLPLAFRSPVAERAVALADAWKIDPVHSTLLFKIKHMDTGWFIGRFNAFTGEVAYDAAKPENCKVNCTIDVASVDTNNDKRDGHLKSQDFFSVKEFPTMTFASTKVELRGESYAVAGDLTLHGVKKPITFTLAKIGASKTVEAGDRMGFYGTAQIKRGDFGIKYGEGALGEEVEITLAMEVQR